MKREVMNQLFLELAEVVTVKLLPKELRPFVEGDEVMVYDRYRFAVPLRAVIRTLSRVNDGVEVKLLESNNPRYPVGGEKEIWVHLAQLRHCV